MDELKSVYSELINEHRAWINPFGKQRLNKWEELLKGNSEAAICEASTRKLMSDCRIKVKPHEDISSGGPDFLCIKKGKRFYVEVTCITKEAATKKTGLSDVTPGTSRVQRFGLLTKRILNEMCNKTAQCSNLDAPCILAIGTLHAAVGHICFSKKFASHILTGTPKISVRIDPEQGRAIGDLHQTTDLQDSGFVRPNRTSTNSIEEARRTISAVLLCSFGTTPPRAIGLLHPNPNHSFDRTSLPKIEFCKLVEGYKTGKFKVKWI